jgi:signal transduction histidine kinase
VRWLQHGVDALRQGDLQVVVPRRTNDELGALTHAFNQMVGRVSEMLRARDQLLLDVSHELRSPLTRMKVALALCDNDEHTQRLRANIDEMERMVADLLELERLRQGHGLQLEQHDLMEIVRDAIATFEDYAPGVHLERAPQSLLLRLDADKVRTALGNLLENAAKYALPESAATRVCVTQNTESVQLRVTDDGPGIPSGDLGNLFEPFFRVDRSRSKRTGGYGLGLSLCKRIMEAHHGSIRALNNDGRGTTFILTFARTSCPLNEAHVGARCSGSELQAHEETRSPDE